jgi:hypothetical protein
MPATNIVLNHLLPSHAVELGRLVSNMQSPEQDFFQSTEITLSPSDISVQQLRDFEQLIEESKSFDFSNNLSTIFSAGRGTHRTSKVSIASAVFTTRQLQNSSSHLEKLCASRPARFWLERAIRRSQNVYLVTSIQTVVDARVQDEASRGTSFQVKAEAPLTLAAAGAGFPLPVDGMLDVGGQAGHAKTHANGVTFTAPDEQVFAVQYRKLRINRFSSRKVDGARLEQGNRWKMYIGGKGNDEEIEEDISIELE